VAAITSSATTTQTRNQLSPKSEVRGRDGKSEGSNRLPRVLLKTHVKVIASVILQITNGTEAIRWLMKAGANDRYRILVRTKDEEEGQVPQAPGHPKIV